MESADTTPLRVVNKEPALICPCNHRRFPAAPISSPSSYPAKYPKIRPANWGGDRIAAYESPYQPGVLVAPRRSEQAGDAAEETGDSDRACGKRRQGPEAGERLQDASRTHRSRRRVMGGDDPPGRSAVRKRTHQGQEIWPEGDRLRVGSSFPFSGTCQPV